MSAPILRTRLRVPLDKFGLDVDFTASKRVLGIFGSSGSGKTTWLESVAGLRRKAEGLVALGDEVWLDSDQNLNLPPEKRGVGYVPQEHLLFPHRNVRQNLEFGMGRGHFGTTASSKLSAEVVDALELSELLPRGVSGLSGGERQRVALGRALCSSPRLLLLDEPLASLDSSLRHRILPFLLKVRNRFDLPMVVVSHNPLELQALCDEVVLLSRGRLIRSGTPTKVFTQPDIYASGGAPFENILSATVTTHYAHTTRLRLGSESKATCISVLRTDHPTGKAVTLGIPARDILIATRRLEGVSARNQLDATITAITEVGNRVVVTTRLSSAEGPQIVAELTKDAIEDLKPTIGSGVFLVVKSSSVTVYG